MTEENKNKSWLKQLEGLVEAWQTIIVELLNVSRRNPLS
jgi:hypothetical protein